MKKFEIEFTSNVIVEAENCEDAARIFLLKQRDPSKVSIKLIFDKEAEKCKEVFSMCESCNQPILEDHEYFSGEDCDVHKKCVDPEDLAKANGQEEIR